MPNILLVRHAQALANKGDFVAFDNISSPLTEKGLVQCGDLITRLISEFGVKPDEYDNPVVASEFVRPQQTAREVGFREVHILPLLNEPDFSHGPTTGVQIVRKHRRERWAPDGARRQARELIDLLTDDKLPYYIAFTHGMFIATVLLELEEAGHDMNDYFFDQNRCYVPLQAAITKISM